MNANTNRVQMDYPSGLTLRYDMDRRNRVTSIYDVDASASVAANLYDDANRLTRRDFGNSRRATWGYDSRGQVTDITHNNAGSTPTICDYNYGYDDVGRPRWREDTVTSDLSEIYGYDNGNRLTTFERGILAGSPPYDVNTNTTFTDLTQIENWNLDLVGNWDELMRQVDASTNTIDYDFNVANEITSSGYTHDANGNLSCDGTYYYDYDINNRMTHIRNVSGGSTVMEYYYDALGRRIQRLNPQTEPVGETLFVYNERWQLIEVCDGNTSGDPAIKRFIHAGASLYVDDHVAMDVRASAMSEFDSTDRYYYHADKQFNTMVMTDNTGAIAERVVTDPYGRFVTYDNAYANAQATSRIGNPFFHHGLYYDAEAPTGSGTQAVGVGYQNRARQLDIRTGRYNGRDPIRFLDTQTPGGLKPGKGVGGNSEDGNPCDLKRLVPDVGAERRLHSYEYALNNSTMFFDPMGMAPACTN